MDVLSYLLCLQHEGSCSLSLDQDPLCFSTELLEFIVQCVECWMKLCELRLRTYLFYLNSI